MSERVRAIRQCAFELLFQLDASEPPLESADELEPAEEGTLGPNELSRARMMASESWAFRRESDRLLSQLAPDWPALRMPVADRCVLRLGIWELGERETPQRVVINEAVELAKLYGTESSPGFVNGVLDAAMQRLRPENEISQATNSDCSDATEQGDV